MTGSLPRDWPHADHSRFVDVGRMRFHVQSFGEGPSILLLHGAGASTHSFRDLASILSQRFHVVMADHPGLGFSSSPGTAPTVQTFSRLHAQLLEALEVEPQIVLGHSAGASIMANMAATGAVSPKLLVGINGVYQSFGGAMRPIFAGFAQTLSMLPLVPRFISSTASERSIQRLIDNTGSTISRRQLDCYRYLLSDADHVRGTLDEMANWDLTGLEDRFAQLSIPTLLLVGENDLTVPGSASERLAERMEAAKLKRLAGLGHLAHEEAPKRVAALIEEAAQGEAII